MEAGGGGRRVRHRRRGRRVGSGLAIPRSRWMVGPTSTCPISGGADGSPRRGLARFRRSRPDGADGTPPVDDPSLLRRRLRAVDSRIDGRDPGGRTDPNPSRQPVDFAVAIEAMDNDDRQADDMWDDLGR